MKNFKHFFKSASKALVALVLGMLVSTPLFAAAPSEINYQGKLTDSSGVPYNGSKNITFSFWDNATVGSGAQLGANVVVNGVNVVNGVFNTVINVAGIPFLTNQNVYLQIQIDGSNFGPTRQKLVAAPFALAVAAGSVGVTELNTTSVDARYVGKSGNETIDGDKTITGNWVNTANPWLDTEVSDTLTIGSAGSVAAAAIQAGALGPSVRVSSVAVGSVFDSAIVGMSSSKLSGALPALDGSALTGVTATGVGANSVGTTQIIASTIALADLDVADVDGRYLTTGTAQTITGIKTLSANWVNTANPWADNEVSDVLSVLAGSTVSASAIDAGSLPPDVIASSVAVGSVQNEAIVSVAPSKVSAGSLGPTVIASSVAVNAVTTTQILNNTIALADLNTGDVDGRYITTSTAQGISGLKTLTNGVIIGTSGTEIAKYISVLVISEDVANVGAGLSVNNDITVTGAAVGDAVLVTPPSNWPAGLFFNAFVNSANTVRLVVYNPTGAPINPNAGDFRVTLIQH